MNLAQAIDYLYRFANTGLQHKETREAIELLLAEARKKESASA